MSLWTGDIHVGLSLPRKQQDAESVRSALSEHSQRSRRAHSTGGRPPRHHRKIKMGGHVKSNGVEGVPRTTGECIEVQILNQDDNWGDNTTAVTGSDSQEEEEEPCPAGDVGAWGASAWCHMWAGPGCAALLSLAAFVSPILMIALPKVESLQWPVGACGPECDGLLIALSFKMVVLAAGAWALFFRTPQVTLPRVLVYRCVVLALLVVCVCAYWLFYGVRIAEPRHPDYGGVVAYAASLVDTLLLLHYLAVLLLELRHLPPRYYVKVVRSPDGESHSYTLGQLSIQRASALVLEHYYRDFSVYNPYLETLPPSRHRRSFKVYDVDRPSSRATPSEVLSRRDSHNERFYEEHDYERRVRKRRARLVSAAEDAFAHIRRMHAGGGGGPAIPMDPSEAASAIFPSLARPLQKYLRLTRQQPRHTMRAILGHLALCVRHGLSPRAFLEKYVSRGPVLNSDPELHCPRQGWALVCDTLLSRPLAPGCVFVLRQGDVSLLVSVSRLPHLSIAEEVLDPKSDRFVLRLNSETSV